VHGKISFIVHNLDAKTFNKSKDIELGLVVRYVFCIIRKAARIQNCNTIFAL